VNDSGIVGTGKQIPGGGSFNEIGHVYRNDNYVIVPSVTQAIREAGLGVNLVGAPQWALEKAGERGRRIHKALLFALEGDLNWRTLDATLKPVVKAGVKALSEAGFELTRGESRFVSKRYHYGGTPDYEGLLNGTDAVVDAKSGSTVPIGATGLQVSGYALGIAERREIDRRPKRYVLRLWPKRGEARLIAITTDPYEDEADFLAAVRVWHRNHRADLNKEMR